MKLSSAPPSLSDLGPQTNQLSFKPALEPENLTPQPPSLQGKGEPESPSPGRGGVGEGSAPAANSPTVSKQQLQPGALAVFGSTFLTIFLSEMGDKTQVATLLMSAESQSPWLIFAGASSALVTTSLLGCLLGRWLANRISPRMLKTAAGVSLLFISVQLFWEILH